MQPPHLTFNSAPISSRHAAHAEGRAANFLQRRDKAAARSLAEAIRECADFYEAQDDDTPEETTRWCATVAELHGVAEALIALSRFSAPQPTTDDVDHAAQIARTALRRFASVAGVPDPNPEQNLSTAPTGSTGP
ncbi:hypothetical protein OIE69_44285 (plasmid) [Actinacidiphila glaucinigra]|uniref:hypothetical protein n=1 Tax=Actinacidiphila glaucinigra TaxID=235986 RepID=UPI002DD9D243|nr:hypothetical protein [Actinacidiphila glaucinigra]WSD65924.1 hypothetical protein OIE69_44285 [Actinacidiphila glaucinigra]